MLITAPNLRTNVEAEMIGEGHAGHCRTEDLGRSCVTFEIGMGCDIKKSMTAVRVC
jgi:hypothetical protein